MHFSRFLTLFPKYLRACTAAPVCGFFTQTSREQRCRDTCVHIPKYFQIYPSLLVYCSSQLFAPCLLYSCTVSAKSKCLLKLILSHFYSFSLLAFSSHWQLYAATHTVFLHAPTWFLRISLGKNGKGGSQGVQGSATLVTTPKWRVHVGIVLSKF